MCIQQSDDIQKTVASVGEIKTLYTRFISRKIVFLVLEAVILILLILVATCIGSAGLTISDVVMSVIARVFPVVDVSQFGYSVIWNLRLPRVMMAVVSGMGLAISGVQMQGITRNPLVSPFTVGISAAAALGASLAILFGVKFVSVEMGTYLVIGSAFVFAMLCTSIVFGLSKLKGSSAETLILAGIALTYFFSAITSILHFFAAKEDLMAMVHWTFGTFTGSAWNEIVIVAVVITICVPIFLKYSWDLNAMAAGGDEAAKGLGVNTARVRSVSLVLSAFITATIISFTGIIGFVCLVAPHITRYIIGGDHRYLLPGSCIIGAILTVGADVVGRTILSPIILPVSIVVSFIGVPLFIYLLLTKNQNYWGK